jgi:hypothetical protein
MCVGAHQGNWYGIPIKTVPRAVIINHEDLIGSNALFAKKANTIVNRDKDYISTVLQTQKQMIKVVPIRPDQIVDFLDPDGTPRSVQTIAKVFEGRKEVKHTLVRNWLQAAFVAKDLDNNADSTSQLQIEPELPEYFSVEQSSAFYTDLQIGFDDENHTFGTTVAEGIRTVAQRLQELSEKAIDGHLTSADMMAYNVVQATALNTAPPAPASKEKGALGTRAFNLCGWAHLQPSELKHSH